ncbi:MULTISPECIES: antitoxin MazE7 [Streptomyces]|uniref:antitoxin MazE7 n=1 Tax=Streptomyces TaxID=1883 RepID=UPI00240DF535|nr:MULTISPECIES: antitoxin MazE7 [Streptomyces]WFB82589.1 antitoxin MazE7 [Streptomyces olivaceus]WGK44126.1 antitoxin MazE7 [Streptomyces sp. B146]
MAGIEIDDTTADALRALADAAGLPLDAYLARVAEEKRRERALAEGAEIFRRITSDPETVAAFDAEYGGPAPAQHAPRAA